MTHSIEQHVVDVQQCAQRAAAHKFSHDQKRFEAHAEKLNDVGMRRQCGQQMRFRHKLHSRNDE